MQATLSEFLSGLTEPQREAVLHTDGPLLILAGPGSGKTRVVTRRAAHLACTVVEARHILAITFTNKAAREMQERIDRLAVAKGMTVGTFHALCARLLRENDSWDDVPPNFTVFDREDRRRLIRRAIEECGLSTDNWPPRSVEHEISLAKSNLMPPEAWRNAQPDFRGETVARIYECYEQLLSRMGGLDFDDLLMRLALLLEQDAALRDRLEDRYRYVLIDEYQDTNLAQYRIARLLTRKNRNLCATGDPDQSIYAWRGANLQNILRFEQDFPDAKVVHLDQNYRSTKRILTAADRLIAENESRKERTLWTDNDDGVSVRVLECESEREEAGTVAQEIARELQAGARPGDIAIFYRVNSLSRMMEEALLHAGVPYQIARGVAFYNRKEIKDVLAYLRVLVNPADDVSLLRIINTPPRGIGGTTLERLTRRAEAAGLSICNFIRRSDTNLSLGRSTAKVRDFTERLRELGGAMNRPPAAALDFVLSHSGLRAFYGRDGEIDSEPLRNLDELMNAAADFQNTHPGATLLDWLEYTALVSDVDTIRESVGSVTLMTLHAAKGLEFDTVYILGLEEGLLPFQRLESERVDVEEERRLLFVGMTRARRRLTLIHARYRMVRGATRRTTRSPFLLELPEDQVEWGGGTRDESAGAAATAGQWPKDAALWEVGTLVRHPSYGLGRVMSLHRVTGRAIVDVLFRDASRHKLALGFAPLERVEFDELGDLADPV